MSGLVEKLRRKLSHKDENPNFDEHDEFDDETTGTMHRDIEEAETSGNPKEGSFLSRLIAHGNKKTEDQIRSESAASSHS